MNQNDEQMNLEMEKMLYIDLPNLIHKILHLRLNPAMFDKDLLKSDIEELKKITNAECEAAISYAQKLGQT